jgi:D-methionine transport system ATP-binding protein
MNISENIIEIRGLTKTFTTKNGSFTALNNIDLDIERGEIFGIIGLSGAGKSTLVRCINRLESPTGGTITFDGREMGALKTKELNSVRREMGMIFQQFNLLMQRTALQNVCFPMIISGVPKAEAIERAKELLCSTDAGVFEIANSIGYEDQFYFYKIFKKYTSLSPSEYRKNKAHL